MHEPLTSVFKWKFSDVETGGSSSDPPETAKSTECIGCLVRKLNKNAQKKPRLQGEMHRRMRENTERVDNNSCLINTSH